MKHVIDYLESIEEVFDFIILLQPTSPLRNYKDIDSAFEVMFNLSASAVISTYEFDNKILKTFTEDSNGFLESISNNKHPFMRRQDLPSVYMPNGAIYITNVKSFRDSESFLTSKTVNYVMDIRKSLDVDVFKDLNSIKNMDNI